MTSQSVLFVCLGNICRSPTAEGVFRSKVSLQGASERILADSAGIGSWHIGNPPDQRAQAAAEHRGIDLSGQRARQLQPEDFEQFDYVIAMDHENRRTLARMAGSKHRAKVRMMLEFADLGETEEVPDPYYGGEKGFDQVLDMIEAASDGLLREMLQHDQR